MSTFWDNNKESIISGAAKGAKVTGKYAWKGAKVAGKAGYETAKNQRNAAKGVSSNDPPELVGEARPVSSLPDVSALPPPPLKPGQMQYHSERKRQLLSGQPEILSSPPSDTIQPPLQPQGSQQQVLQVPQTSLYMQSPQNQQPQGYVQAPAHQQDQLPAGIAPSSVRPVPGLPQRSTQQAPQISQPEQPQQPETIRVPPSEVQVGGTTVNLPAMNVNKQQAFNIAGQLMSGVVQSQVQSQQQPSIQSQSFSQSQPSQPALLTLNNPYYSDAVADQSSSSPSSSYSHAAPPPPPARNYTRSAASLPPQVVSISESPSASPSPDLSNLPVPPKRAVDPINPVASPLVSGTPSTPTNAVPAISVGGATPAVSVGAAVNGASSGSATPHSKNNQQEGEEHVDKGISGSYDYKIDVKFAPPPKRHDSARTVAAHNLKDGPEAFKRPSIAPSAAPLPPRSTTLTPTSSNSSSSAPPPPPPPARTNSSNFPPPPRPTNPQAQQSNTFLPPPRPTNPKTHLPNQNVVSSAPPTYAHANSSGSPPPEYRQSFHSPEPAERPVPPPISARPSFDVSKLAPPPKPFRRPEEQLESTQPPPPSPPAVVSKPKPEVPTSKPVIPSFKHTTAETKQELKSNAGSMSTPPVPGPKPLSSKSSPPPLKPKPASLQDKVPPPVKPKPASLQDKVPPPVKPKPSALHAKSAPPVTKKPTGIAAVVSELKMKESKEATTHDKDEEEEEEEEEDNPFKRYLKAAVPSQDDRFH